MAGALLVCGPPGARRGGARETRFSFLAVRRAPAGTRTATPTVYRSTIGLYGASLGTYSSGCVIRKTYPRVSPVHLRDQGAPKTYRSDHIRTEIHVNIEYNATTHDDLSPTHKAKPLADLRGCTRRCGGSSSSLRITRGRCVSMHAPDHDNAPMRMHSQPRRPSSPRTMHPFGYTSSGCMSSGCSPWCLDAREPELGPAPPCERHTTQHMR